jgi:hypothetical protein
MSMWLRQLVGCAKAACHPVGAQKVANMPTYVANVIYQEDV